MIFISEIGMFQLGCWIAICVFRTLVILGEKPNIPVAIELIASALKVINWLPYQLLLLLLNCRRMTRTKESHPTAMVL